MKRVGIYLRVSTSKQDTDNQRRELEVVAKRSGWQVVKVFEDNGISGAKGRDKRPGLDAMLKAVNARELDMVASWSVDRLGRSLRHLIDTLTELEHAFKFNDAVLRHLIVAMREAVLTPSPMMKEEKSRSMTAPGAPTSPAPAASAPAAPAPATAAVR